MPTAKPRLTRRRFLASSAAASALAFTFVPDRVIGAPGRKPPSEKLNIACIGVGGRGDAQLGGCGRENIVALCDVSQGTLAKAASRFPGAKQYRDFRKLLDEMDNQLDAVTVSTPDHTHAVALMAAMKRGKHVYSEKPLAHSVHEIRQLMKAAAERKLVTQLGNQGHSSNTIRLFCEWIWDGAIGKVHTIHAGCDSVYSRIRMLGLRREKPPVPPELDWDLWLGPAPFRPYHPMYLPGQWRGWSDFGTGVIGDWVCHIVDPVFWALDLGAPSSVQAQAKDYDPKVHGDTFPRGVVVKYQFAAKGQRGPITLYWRDGSEWREESRQALRPADLDAERQMPSMGAVVLGEKGGITYGSHGAGGVRIYPEAQMKAYKQPPQKLPRVRDHHQDWLQAIRKNTKAGSDFSYGGPLAELALLGAIAIRHLGQELKWDGAAMRFTNSNEANQLLNPPYREGWAL